MEIVFIYIILMLITLAISIKFKKKIGISTFITIASISITQYMCGIMGLLPIGKPIIIIVYCTSLIYLICNLMKKLYFLGIVQNIDIIKVTTKE